MPHVRCPVCAAIVADPAPEYRCPSCHQKLRWRSVTSVGPVQLGLFGEAVPLTDTASRRRRVPPAPFEAVSDPRRVPSPRFRHRDVLAAATELFHADKTFSAEAIGRAQAVFDDLPIAELRGAALGGASLLALTLRWLEHNTPGAGLDILHTLGLVLAQEDDEM
jgi:hypothetical protein